MYDMTILYLQNTTFTFFSPKKAFPASLSTYVLKRVSLLTDYTGSVDGWCGQQLEMGRTWERKHWLKAYVNEKVSNCNERWCHRYREHLSKEFGSLFEVVFFLVWFSSAFVLCSFVLNDYMPTDWIILQNCQNT